MYSRLHSCDGFGKGHLQALLNLPKFDGFNCWNLGTGKGYSVLQVIKKFEEITGKVIKYKFGNRRPGDLPVSFASATKAKKICRGLRAETLTKC